jgi:hypothetical protein
MIFVSVIPRLAASLTLSLVASSALAEVPLRIADTGHATVPVAGSFGEHQFVLDTGAEGSAIYEDFAKTYDIPDAGSIELQGQTGASSVALANIEELSLDGIRKGPIEAVKLPPRSDGVPLAGIVGLDLFGDRTLDFDLPKRRVALLAPGAVPAGLSSKAVDATPTTGQLLTVPVRIGSVTATAVIDTGARKTRINWNLARLLQIGPDDLIRGETIYGATNVALETGATQLHDVNLGDRHLAVAPVLVADLNVFEVFGVADRPAVILGMDWLWETRLVVDFPGKRVWFEAAR